jgi:hypothetical protein
VLRPPPRRWRLTECTSVEANRLERTVFAYDDEGRLQSVRKSIADRDGSDEQYVMLELSRVGDSLARLSVSGRVTNMVDLKRDHEGRIVSAGREIDERFHGVRIGYDEDGLGEVRETFETGKLEQTERIRRDCRPDEP